MGRAKTPRWKRLTRFRNIERKHAKRSARLSKEALREHILVPPDEIRLEAPQQFALESDSHNEVVDFLAKLRAAISSQRKTVSVDFRQTKEVIAGATLLFFSEMQRLKSMYPNAMLRCIPSKTDAVNQAFKHLKIFDMFGYTSAVVPSRPDVVNWRTASSSEIDGARVGTLIDTFSSLKGDMAKQIFRGATEAMLNSMNHAYLEDRKDGLPAPVDEKWWMFCRQEKDQIIVAVCDLGIGIPRSLPLKYTQEVLEQAMRVLSGGKLQTDARMVQAAMELARTRTQRKGRGLGLHDLKRIVDEVPGGRLYIFSNKGLVSYRDGGFRRKNFTRSIKGTVVVWMIPLEVESDD